MLVCCSSHGHTYGASQTRREVTSPHPDRVGCPAGREGSSTRVSYKKAFASCIFTRSRGHVITEPESNTGRGNPRTDRPHRRPSGWRRPAPVSRPERRFSRKHNSSRPRCLEMPTRSALDGWAATGSVRRLADSQHDSDQVVQRPGQVLLGDQDNLVIDAKMADRPSRNRAVRRRGGQRPCEEFLPRASVAGRDGVHHPVPHGGAVAACGWAARKSPSSGRSV